MDNSKYNAKATDSFNTKKKLFIFDRVINNGIISSEEFKSFEIGKELVNVYTSEYWQFGKEEKIQSLQIEDIYKKMKEVESNNNPLFSDLLKEYVASFEDVFPRKKLDELITQTNCEYCDISTNDIQLLANKNQLFKKTERGWNLEIDRINSNFEYKPDNCVMACYWCNNAKTDEFNYDEFSIIAKGISTIWKQRLNDN